MEITNYYYKLTDKPELGMLYWEEGKYLHPYFCNPPATPAAVVKAHKQFILRIKSSYTVTADSDADCDRICECVDYQPLEPQNIIMDGDTPVGVYLDLGFYYCISSVRPNVIVLPFEAGAGYYNRESRNTYTLEIYDPEKSYESSSHIY